MLHDIKAMVAFNRKVQFQFYREGELWYKTETGFEFPVPTNDVGNAAMLREDKALLFMRWIRKHVKYLEDARKEHESLQST